MQKEKEDVSWPWLGLRPCLDRRRQSARVRSSKCGQAHLATSTTWLWSPRPGLLSVCSENCLWQWSEWALPCTTLPLARPRSAPRSTPRTSWCLWYGFSIGFPTGPTTVDLYPKGRPLNLTSYESAHAWCSLPCPNSSKLLPHAPKTLESQPLLVSSCCPGYSGQCL